MTCFYRVQLDLEKLQILVFVFEYVVLSMMILVYLQLSDLGQGGFVSAWGKKVLGKVFLTPLCSGSGGTLCLTALSCDFK